MINEIDFSAKNLMSNADQYLLLENAKNNGVFELIDADLVLDNDRMNHIKTACPKKMV